MTWEHAALLALGFLVGFAFALLLLGVAQHKQGKAIAETLSTLRSQHLDQRLMRARALIEHWREIARDEEGDPDAAVRAVRKMCAMDLQRALEESEP